MKEKDEKGYIYAPYIPVFHDISSMPWHWKIRKLVWWWGLIKTAWVRIRWGKYPASLRRYAKR
jgi:hypothetical protein